MFCGRPTDTSLHNPVTLWGLERPSPLLVSLGQLSPANGLARPAAVVPMPALSIVSTVVSTYRFVGSGPVPSVCLDLSGGLSPVLPASGPVPSGPAFLHERVGRIQYIIWSCCLFYKCFALKKHCNNSLVKVRFRG